MALENPVNGCWRATHLRRDFTDGISVSVQLRDPLAVQNQPRPPADAALLARLRQAGVDSLGDANALLLGDASQRRFDLVLFWSLDRFSREGVLETLHHLQRLAQYGVGYRSFTEQYLDSCGIFKDAVLSILATIAKQERIRISKRVHAGLAKARKQGRIGGRPRRVLSHARVLARSQDGATIREIAEEMGVSPAAIHRILKGHHRVTIDTIPV